MVCKGVLLPVVLLGPKVTLLFVLLADLTSNVFPVFRMEVGDLVDTLDVVESDDLVVATVIELDLAVDAAPQKPELGAHL